MKRKANYIPVLLLVLAVAEFASAQNKQSLVLNRADELEVVFENGRFVTYVSGKVDFRTETGHIYSDSAVFVREEYAILRGNVFVDDQEYMLRSDSIHYDLTNETAVARGDNVQLWSYRDSLYAAGTHAFFDRRRDAFSMEQRPTVYIGYPDTTNMVEVVADFVDYEAAERSAEAMGNVVITSKDVSARSGCAVMNLDGGALDLYDDPVAERGRSTISGEFISIMFADEELRQIDVIDSAYGEFIEPVDTTKDQFDKSLLRGSRIKMFFQEGLLSEVEARGQAYSWYYPSPRGSREYHENSVSGDTIRFYVQQERLYRVTVTGGAQGTYITGKTAAPTPEQADLPDTSAATDTAQGATLPADLSALPAVTSGVADTMVAASRLDTISYRSHYIDYSVLDSIIRLETRSEVLSGQMALRAHDVEFDTRRRIVEAFSAEINPDSQEVEFYSLAKQLQPATIPVVLKDADDELFGDYLEYSIDTQKGRIVQTKSEFEQGFYYGDKLFRENRDVYYVDDGRFTTCNAEEPHFHFYSPRMKLMQNNKLIARPVVFYLGRLPLLAIPYYVFPMKRGRHSGVLPFTFGRFERGERYISNLGYYWAASEYWDWQGAVDYYEQQQTLTFKSRVQFGKRYLLSGHLKGEYRRLTRYNRLVGRESKPSSYQFDGSYNHEISPSFNVRASGNYVSTATYYTDYSNSLAERLNRELVSQVNFAKRFGEKISLTGSVQHRENLDLESRTDQLPTLNVSLPPIYPFGASSTNAEGEKVSKWYNSFILRYNPSLVNHSERRTIVVDTFTTLVDTTITIDSLGIPDTTITRGPLDSLTARSRRHYARIQHNPSITLPTIRVIPYVNIVPGVQYSETWFKIFETDQSDSAGIDASRLYRTYSYSAGASANTKLYGTVYPNMFGLIGLRHVFEPSVSYSWSPDIQRHPTIRQFAGGGAASTRSQRIGISLEHLLQAKTKAGEVERNLDLLSISSSFSYDLERDFRPLSNVSTNFHTTTVPGVNISGSMVHTFYTPYDAGSDTPELLSPWLLSFDLDISFQLAGQMFLFTDPVIGVPQGADSLQQLDDRSSPTPVSTRSGWNMAVTYSYTETGRHTNFQKSSFVNLTLGFGVTPKTSVNYMQRYDIEEGRTVSSQVNLVRDLHCWTGSLFWVPTGSNRGFGFKLWVTALPDIKLDSNHDTFVSTDVLRRP